MAKKQTVKSNKSDKVVLGVLIAALVVIVVGVVILIIGMANSDGGTASGQETGTTATQTTATVDMTAVRAEIDSYEVDDFVETDEVTEYVKFTVTGFGSYVLKLRADVAPISVQNFQNLVAQDFYTGSVFHRVMKNFMIQGGAAPIGSTVSVKTIKGEFSANGVNNTLSHIPGVISMARSTPNDSATTQFFISNSESTPSSLDGRYAAFGYVVAGMDVINAITNIPVHASSTGEMSVPDSQPVIEGACFVRLK